MAGDNENQNLPPSQRSPNPAGENRYNPYQRAPTKIELTPSYPLPPNPLAENRWYAQYNHVTTTGWDQRFGIHQTLGMEHHFGMNANLSPMTSPHFGPPSWTPAFQALPAFCQYQINKANQQQAMSPSFVSSQMFYNLMLLKYEQDQQRQIQQQEQERQYQIQLRQQQRHMQQLQYQHQLQLQQQQQRFLPPQFWWPSNQ